jgi:hypothetical protein
MTGSSRRWLLLFIVVERGLQLLVYESASQHSLCPTQLTNTPGDGGSLIWVLDRNLFHGKS